jgi:hypothetical protein
VKEQLDFSWEDALADLKDQYICLYLFMQDKQAEIS